MFETIEELLEAYKEWEIMKISDTLYYVQYRVFKVVEVDGKFAFEAIE